jgi:hypothetical protein
VQSQREIDKEFEIGTRFYITSSTDTASQIAAIVQNHWAI